MAKIVIAGSAMILTSALKLTDLEEIQKYAPDKLCIVDEETKEPLFRVAVKKGVAGSASAYGVTFGQTTNDGTGCACVTMTAPSVDGGPDKLKDVVADVLGGAYTGLTKLEESLPGVLQEVRTKKASLIENINIQA